MANDRLIKRVQLFYKLASYWQRKDFLKAMGQDAAPSLSGPVPPPPGTPKTFKELFAPKKPAAPESPVQTLPEVNIEGFPPVDPKTQDQLNDLLATKGLIFPELELDGKLGPETKKAMDTFTNQFGMPATPQNIRAVWEKELGGREGIEAETPF